VLTICWTSGTESRPKGVPRDHNHWLLNARVVAEATGMVAGDVLLNPFPLVNIGSIGGLVMPWLLLGGRLILHHPFDLGIFLGQIAAESVTYTIAPPAVLTALLDQPGLISGGAIASLRAIGSGSAPLSPWLIDGWLTRHAIQICNIFGSNEGASLFSSHVDVPDTTARARYFPRYGAEGIKWPGLTPSVMRTRLADPATGATITTPGQPGELRIGGGNVFAGYWRAPELTAAAFDEHDAVAVVPKGADVPDLAEVVAWMARAHDVAVFKRPERLVVVDRLPRNAMNKVVRNDLRALVLARL
jgi:cyclohexanecarboxylate-CoA ligase